MKITGIIAEYNPFHNGHAYQLEFAKTFSDTVIVVMSGSFVQRGDVAIFDKYSRTEIALKNGADIVFELPVVFSMSTAERFAFGGVSILNSLNVVDFLLFGSECGDIDILKKSAKFLEAEPPEISAKIKKLMDEGISFPKARELAFSNLIPSSLLSSPNNILALEYIKKLYSLNSDITPVTLKRIGEGYHSKNLDSEFMSATAVRNAVLNKSFSYEPFSNAPIHRLDKLSIPVLYNIRKNKEEAFRNISDVSEGLQNRIIKASDKASSIEELVSLVSTKRYTDTKIRRIILASLLGIKSSLLTETPEYVRLLGATKNGFEVLKQIKEKSELKIITKTADFKEKNEMFEKDILSSDIYDLTSDSPKGSGQDFKNSPVIIGGKYE